MVKERWIDGVDLMLYEMVEYWKQYFQQKRSAKILARPPAQKQQQHNFPVQQQQQRQFHQAPQIPSYSIQQNPNPLPVQRYNSPRVLPVSSSSSTTYGGTHQPPPFKTVAAGYAAPMVQVQNQPYQQQQQNHPHGQLHVRAPTAGNPTTIVTLPHGMRLEPGTTFKFVYEQTYQQNTFQ